MMAFILAAAATGAALSAALNLLEATRDWFRVSRFEAEGDTTAYRDFLSLLIRAALIALGVALWLVGVRP